MIIWNSKTPKLSPEHWYGTYKPKLRIAVLTTLKFGVNLMIKVSIDGTQFKPSLVNHNISISMNGTLLLTTDQWDEIKAAIDEVYSYMREQSDNQY